MTRTIYFLACAALASAQVTLEPVPDAPVVITGGGPGGIGISLSASQTLTLGDGGDAPVPDMPTAELPAPELPVTTLMQPEVPVETIAEPEVPVETITAPDLPVETITATDLPGETIIGTDLPVETIIETSIGQSASETLTMIVSETTPTEGETTLETIVTSMGTGIDETTTKANGTILTSMTMTKTVSPVPEEPTTVADSAAARGWAVSTVLGLVALVPAFFL